MVMIWISIILSESHLPTFLDDPTPSSDAVTMTTEPRLTTAVSNGVSCDHLASTA